MKNIWIEINNWERELEKWGKRDEVYWQGVDIMETWGPNGRLKQLLRKAKKPNSKHWGHLIYQLGKLKPARSPMAPQGKKTSERVDKLPEVERGAVQITVNLQGDKIEELTSRIRQLATARALLSNQLVDPGQDQHLIQKNNEILDKIDPIMDQMKDLEAQVKDIRSGKIQPEVKDADRIVVERSNEQYTMNELYSMPLNELQGLRKRVKQDVWKYEMRAGKNKTESGKKKAMETAKKMNIQVLLIEKVQVERKSIID